MPYLTFESCTYVRSLGSFASFLYSPGSGGSERACQVFKVPIEVDNNCVALHAFGIAIYMGTLQNAFRLFKRKRKRQLGLAQFQRRRVMLYRTVRIESEALIRHRPTSNPFHSSIFSSLSFLLADVAWYVRSGVIFHTAWTSPTWVCSIRKRRYSRISQRAILGSFFNHELLASFHFFSFA